MPPYATEFKDVVTKSGAIAQVAVVMPSDFPTLAGFAIEIQVHRSTLHDWSKRHKEFGEAYSWAELYQERWLRINGLKGYISPPAYVWTSKNTIGDRDKTEQEITGALGIESSKGREVVEKYLGAIDAAINERRK